MLASLPSCGPSNHGCGRCQCPSSAIKIEENDKLQTVNVFERETIL